MYKKPVEFILLPTTGNSHITYNKKEERFFYDEDYCEVSSEGTTFFENYHCHIITEDNQPYNGETCWVLTTKGLILQYSGYNGNSNWKKVIASTDGSLKLPKIPVKFLRSICKKELVESKIYIDFLFKTNSGLGYKEYAIIQPLSENKGIIVELYNKLHQTTYQLGEEIEYESWEVEEWVPKVCEGYIVITPQKENYSKQEMFELFSKFADFVDGLYRPYTSDNTLAYKHKDEWFEKNT